MRIIIFQATIFIAANHSISVSKDKRIPSAQAPECQKAFIATKNRASCLAFKCVQKNQIRVIQNTLSLIHFQNTIYLLTY